MKLAAVVAAAVRGGFIAADKAPDLTKAILAADKRAKDTDPENTGMGPKNLQHAGDKAMDEREEAMDEREEAMDAAEEKADAKDAESKDAKDRKGARDKRAKDRMDRKGARDKRAKDRNDDPEHTNPGGADEDYTEGANPEPPGGHREKGKTAVDSAEVDRRIAAAVAARDALHAARTETAHILGATAFDSAGETYRKALDKLGVDTADIPDSALRAMLTLAKDRASATTSAPVAMDAATSSAVAKAIPGINRLRR